MKGRRPEEYEGLVRTVLLMLMLVSAYFIVRGGARFVSSPQVEMKRERPCVIIDAGHGGVDPGKVSVDGALEKDINLAIAQKLQRFLQQQDVDAVLTRQSDAGLYDENASNKKVQDMKNRVALIEERQQARKDRNFARADEIRDTLAAKGILLKDTREGVKWTRA